MNFPKVGRELEDIRQLVEQEHVAPEFRGRRVFFGCDIEISRRYGISNTGAAQYVRAKANFLITETSDTHDLGLLMVSTAEAALSEISLRARDIVLRCGIPLLIACDHTASCCALLGVISSTEALPIYAYFDAHFDLGRNCRPGDLMHNGGFVGLILEENWVEGAVNIGGRSPATQLSIPLPQGFTSIPHTGLDLDTTFASLRGKSLYVSIDADVLNPASAPNVCCPEPGGMSPENLLACCNWLGMNCRVLGADLSELFSSTASDGCEAHLVSCLIALTEPAAN